MKGQSPGDWRPPPCSWNSQLGGRPAPSAATGPPFCAGAATPTASQASHASQLTAAQRARAEANRQEALRRRAEAGQRKQQGVGPGPAGLQAPPRPAPSSSAGWGLPSAAVAMPDTATSRPPSALRGLFAIPTSLQQSQHPQQYSAGPAGAPQHVPRWPQSAPNSSSWTPQPASQQQQPLPAPSMTIASQGPGAWQPPCPQPQQQHLQHPPFQQHPQQQHPPWPQPASASWSQQAAPAQPPSAQQHPGPAPRSQLPPQPGSALAAIFGSGRPQSAGFSFQPPPGLAPASEVAHIADEGRQQEQSALVPDAGTYARKHLAGAVPTWPSAQANGSGHGGQQAGWQAGSAQAPIGGPVSIGNAVTMGQWPGTAAVPPQPVMQGARAGSRGGSKGGSRGAPGSITVSYGPPQPQKPTTQISLKQALTRHAKAKERQQEQQQQVEQLEEEQWQQQLPVAALPGSTNTVGDAWAPQQQQRRQFAQQQPPVSSQWLPQASMWDAGQGTPGSGFVPQSVWSSAAAAAEGTPPAAVQHPPAPGRQRPPLPTAYRQLSTSQPACPFQPLDSAPSRLPPLSGNAGALPSLAQRRPPLAPARPAGGTGSGPGSGAAAAAAGRWTPGSAATPTAGRSGEPASEKERRLRLQRLLCDVRDPFEPASTGGRWDWLREPRDAEGQPRSHPDHDPTTLHIPPSAFGTDLTGAHAQYWRIKAAGLAHCVLFFQEGNFYHLKDTDADIGMRVGLSAMGGARGSAANMWTVGCNTSAFNEWAAKVLALGYPVARVGECKRGTREPGSTLVKRTLRQVYTPGTLLDGTMADTCGGSQPLVTLWEGEHLRFGACVVDVQTATVSFTSWQEADTQRSMLQALLLQTDPAEVGFARGQLSADTRKLLRQELAPGGRSGRPVALTPIPHLLPCNPEDPAVAEELLDHTADMFATHRGKPAAFAAARPQLSPHAAAALQLAIHHLLAAQAAQHVLPPCSLVCGDGLLGAARGSGYMLLDACALRSLELLSNSEGGLPGSLLHLLNGAASAAGRRKARQFISNPLYRVGDIEERLATTELFMKHGEAADAFQAGLHRAPDCDRLLAKAANVLAAVVDRVEAAEAAEAGAEEQGRGLLPTGTAWGAGAATGSSIAWGPPSASNAWALRGPQQHGQQGGAAGRWAGSSHGPPAADARQQAPAAGQVAQLAAVLDLSQATFAPVVALFEGVGMLLQALHGLRCAMTAARGSQAPLPPPLQRASMAGEEVAGALQQLSQVFDAERFNDAAADIGLEQGLCAEYDAARASQEQLQAQVAGAVESIRQGLAGRGHGAAALKRVKLVDFRGQQLLEVPTAVRRDLEGLAQVVLVKEAQTIAKYRLPALETTLQALEEARDAAKLCVLRFLAESTQLFLDSYDSFRRLLNALSTLDVLAGFAAATHPSAAPPGCSFCRPSFVPGAAAAGEAPPLHLEGLWSPALLASQGVQRIQPNSLSLGGFGSGQGTQAPQPGMLLLTGANTGGKSTLLRAACLAAVMAQVGCYVPCSQAELAPVDRIYTRIGAQDRIFSGESTFAVEMLETSSLLRHATPASLVVLDELGRGTSTHDGHAIAHGVARWLAGTKRCRCLFATHFHALCRQPELTALAQVAHMQSAAAPGSGLTPFYRLAPGPAPQGSCGINVAASCGLPPSVVARAAQVARQQEEQAGERSAGSPASAGAAAGSPPRLPLQPLNQPSPGRPGAKRQRRMEQQQQEEGPSLQAAIAGEAANDLAEEQQEALAAVRLAVQALLAGAPGAVQQLLRLQAEVAAALATGEL